MQKRTMIAIGLALGMAAGCQASAQSAEGAAAQAPTEERTKEQNMQKPQGGANVKKKMAILDDAHAAFQAAEGERFARHYSPTAVMVLSNGTVLRGRDGLAEAAAKSGPSVREWRVDRPNAHRVEHGGYLAGESKTVLALPDGKELDLRGQRLVYWTQSDGTIAVDVSVPSTEAKVPADVQRQIDVLAQAWNDHDVETGLSVFTDDAVYVLSDGRVFAGEAVKGVLEFAFGAQIEGMKVTPRKAWLGGEDTAYVSADYAFRFKPGDAVVDASGCRLDVWKRSEAGWRLAVQVAQPSGSSACVR